MSSSSGSWFITIILLAAGAILILTLNEANLSNLKGGAAVTERGSKYLSDFLNRFTKHEEQTESRTTPPKKLKFSSKPIVDSEHQDEMGHRDRAELNDLLEKVGK